MPTGAGRCRDSRQWYDTRRCLVHFPTISQSPVLSGLAHWSGQGFSPGANLCIVGKNCEGDAYCHAGMHTQITLTTNQLQVGEYSPCESRENYHEPGRPLPKCQQQKISQQERKIRRGVHGACPYWMVESGQQQANHAKPRHALLRVAAGRRKDAQKYFQALCSGRAGDKIPS